MNEFIADLIKFSLKVLVCVAAVSYVGMQAFGLLYSTEGVSDGTCNIAVVSIKGVIAGYGDTIDEFGNETLLGERITSPEYVEAGIARALADGNIEGILFDIDSPGGAAASSEKMAFSINNHYECN